MLVSTLKPSPPNLQLRQDLLRVNWMFDQQEQATKEPMLQPRCPCCGKPETIIWVHGHGQCVHCKMNVMPCCDGAQEVGE